MIATNLTFLGLNFIPVDFNDIKGTVEVLESDYPDFTFQRYLILVQEKKTSGFEVISTLNARQSLMKVGRGGVSRYLRSKYGDKVMENIVVWIAISIATGPAAGVWVSKRSLEICLLGQWVDKEAEAARARTVGGRLTKLSKKNPPEFDNFKAQCPEVYRFLTTNGYFDPK